MGVHGHTIQAFSTFYNVQVWIYDQGELEWQLKVNVATNVRNLANLCNPFNMCMLT